MEAARNSIIIVKLGAVAIVVLAMQSLADHVVYFSGWETEISLQLSIFALSFIVPCAFAAGLWFFPAKIAGVASIIHGDSISESANSEQLLLIGLSLLGIYATVFGAIDLLSYEAHQIIQNNYARRLGIENPEIVMGLLASRIVNTAQIVIGILLVLGRRGLARLLIKIRLQALVPPNKSLQPTGRDKVIFWKNRWPAAEPQR